MDTSRVINNYDTIIIFKDIENVFNKRGLSGTINVAMLRRFCMSTLVHIILLL